MALHPGGPSVLLWSGGKDAMLALHEHNLPFAGGAPQGAPEGSPPAGDAGAARGPAPALESGTSAEGSGVGPVTCLLTAVTADEGRVISHGVGLPLLRRQADALGLELVEVAIPRDSPNAVYEEIMTAALEGLRDRGITNVIAGDIMLADIKAYREQLHRRAGLGSHFPLWGRDTVWVARRTFALGYETYVIACDGSILDKSLVGQAYDEHFLARLPEGVDPGGEKGEFHTFVVDGPMFQRPVPFRPGETVTRGGFHYKELLP